MGRNKSARYRKTLHQQAFEKMQGMAAFGESKLDGKKDGSCVNKIYSYKTYKTYWQHIKYYLRWLEKTHPDVTTLKKARKYVPEWLQQRTEQGLSPWTIHLECAALCKLYGIRPDDPDRFQPPRRSRMEITRSRGEAARDRHFSVTNNYELIEFIRATGTRRNVLERLRGDDLWSRERMEGRRDELRAQDQLTASDQKLLENLEEALTLFPDQQYFIHHRRDKGGKSRFAIICGPNADMVIDRMRNTAQGERVWGFVHAGCDVHALRAEYCRRIYRMNARPIDTIPYDRVNRGSGRRYQSEVYVCRRDERKKLDKRAMMLASKMLGHSRVSVIAEHYLHGL